MHKYASEDAANADDKMAFREKGKKKAAIVVELVGKERELKRMAKTERLEAVTLRQALISHAGDTEWLNENAVGITSLALEDNLLSDWETVATLTCHLPKLSSLALNGNKLIPLLQTPEPVIFQNAFPSLTQLALNGTGVTLQHIGHVKSYLNHLKDLHLSSNQIGSIGEQSFEGWPLLELIDLSDNGMSSWDDILQLSAFSNLQRLILSNNQFEQLRFPADGGLFPQLRLLAVANNKIADWASMEALCSLPVLAELRVPGNALGEQMGSTALRQMLVARLPGLTAINGGEVRARERVEAQKFYLRYRMQRAEGQVRRCD